MEEALLKAMMSVGFRYPQRGVLLSLGPVPSKYQFTREARRLIELGLPLYATGGTADVFASEGIACVRVSKDDSAQDGPSALALLREKKVDLVINVAREYDAHGIPDGATIRRVSQVLEQEGVPTPFQVLAERGQLPKGRTASPIWYRGAIRRILVHPAYWGEHTAYRWREQNEKIRPASTGITRKVKRTSERPASSSS